MESYYAVVETDQGKHESPLFQDRDDAMKWLNECVTINKIHGRRPHFEAIRTSTEYPEVMAKEKGPGAGTGLNNTPTCPDSVQMEQE